MDAKHKTLEDWREVQKRLQMITEARNITELATNLDISIDLYNNWRARRTIPFKALSEISTKYNINTQWILTGTGEKYNSINKNELMAELFAYQNEQQSNPFCSFLDMFLKLHPTTHREKLFEHLIAQCHIFIKI